MNKLYPCKVPENIHRESIIYRLCFQLFLVGRKCKRVDDSLFEYVFNEIKDLLESVFKDRCFECV